MYPSSFSFLPVFYISNPSSILLRILLHILPAGSLPGRDSWWEGTGRTWRRGSDTPAKYFYFITFSFFLFGIHLLGKGRPGSNGGQSYPPLSNTPAYGAQQNMVGLGLLQ